MKEFLIIYAIFSGFGTALLVVLAIVLNRKRKFLNFFDLGDCEENEFKPQTESGQPIADSKVYFISLLVFILLCVFYVFTDIESDEEPMMFMDPFPAVRL